MGDNIRKFIHSLFLELSNIYIYIYICTLIHTNPLLFIAPIDLLGERMQVGAKHYNYIHNYA
jgi:hypothetical protein